MQRVKNIDYDEDDLYSDGEEDYQQGEPSYTNEDRENFTALTPVVRAELQEAGLQASDREIEDALWHYYWDVGKTVAYLKNSRTPRPAQQQPQQTKKEKEKPKSKFDQAAERSASKAVQRTMTTRTSALDWFHGVSWSTIPPAMQGELVPAFTMSRPQLLGGSSKLAKLAEERRRKAAASQTVSTASDGASSSLDRLSKPRDTKENVPPATKPEPRKYPIRQKREPTPPPKESSPEPEQAIEDVPDLRASPTAFAKTMSVPKSAPQAGGSDEKALDNIFHSSLIDDPFKEPSPDDTVFRAQARSKGINK